MAGREVMIVGAGLAGLIAAHVFPRAAVVEAQTAPRAQHRALLRFRSDEVSKAVDIPFRRVRVHKALWCGGRMFGRADIRHMNWYARKISSSGALTARSIADLATVDRWVAPDSLYDQLVEAVQARITWGTSITRTTLGAGCAVVSTMPLPDAVDAFNSIHQEQVSLPAQPVAFRRAPIRVQRFRVFGADLHQTIYYPGDDHSTYRASITGDTLIVESMDDDQTPPITCGELATSFGIDPEALQGEERTVQRWGKIFPVDDRARRELIHQLTVKHGVYSLGRFATWRNLLLDDVVKDARIIRGLIDQHDTYALRLRA